LRCLADQFARQLGAIGQLGDISSRSVVMVLDDGGHVRISRRERHAAARLGPHQRDTDVGMVARIVASATDHRAESRCVGPDLEIRGRQHRLQRRQPVGFRPVDRQHPFGMIHTGRADRQVGDHRYACGLQIALGADARQHHQMSRSDCAG